VSTFLYSPKNSDNDENAISFNILWPVNDIKAKEAVYRDYLRGISEKKFRSARLHTWFDTPDNYFLEELAKFRNKKSTFDQNDQAKI
jgi:hypothetical protein